MRFQAYRLWLQTRADLAERALEEKSEPLTRRERPQCRNEYLSIHNRYLDDLKAERSKVGLHQLGYSSDNVNEDDAFF